VEVKTMCNYIACVTDKPVLSNIEGPVLYLTKHLASTIMPSLRDALIMPTLSVWERNLTVVNHPFPKGIREVADRDVRLN
jgi:hypothetical protein